MPNTVNVKDLLKDLQEGLAPLVLAKELQQHGKLLLAEELENLLRAAPPAECVYLQETVQEILRFNSKIVESDVKFDKITSPPLRARLERALVAFGAETFHDAVGQLYKQKVTEILDRDLLELMRPLPLKEFKRWTSVRHGMRGETAFSINYDGIKTPATQKRVRKLAQLYGENKVGRRIEHHEEALTQDRLALLVEVQDIPLDPIKAFVAAQAMSAAPAQRLGPTASEKD